MISVYDIGNENFDRNGDAVLHPTSCKCTEGAGGSYEVSMSLPIAGSDEWTHMQNGAIVKVPVPVPTIESAYVGQDVDVYKTKGTASVRSGPSEPTRVTYQTWTAGVAYEVGSKVTNSNYDGHNYQATTFVSGSGLINVPPNNNAAWWKRISDYTSGSPILVTLNQGTEVYYIEDAAGASGWYKISTKNGIIGYMKASDLEFVRHETVEPMPPRTVEDQLFRIYNVEINTDSLTCNVNARHVSYDMAGVIIGDCNIALAQPAMAIARMKDAMLISYRGEIATNLTEEDNGTYTGDMSFRNGIYCLLDPDKGIIPYFRAKLIRDNWDIFLMKNDIADRGIRLQYGKNLRGVNWKRRSDGIINRVMPVAKNEEGGPLYLPEMWIDSPNISTWPVIVMERLQVAGQVGKDDGTGTGTVWTESALFDEMREKAEERFSLDHVDAIQAECTVDFTLMGETEEYRQYRGLERLYLYDVVHVNDDRVGLDIMLQVSEIVWDCIAERYISIKVGNIFDYGGRTVWGYKIGNGAIDYEKISIETIQKIISEVR